MLARRRQDKTIIKRMLELAKEISHHQVLYHQQDNPQISDYEYDLLVRKLTELETRYPELKLPNSPSDLVGAKAHPKFSPFKHPFPMFSLANAMNKEEIEEWAQKRSKDLGHEIASYCVSLKLDGLALEIIYKKGRLIMGATRGDGVRGENITENVLKIANVPKIVDTDISRLVVRGEAIMTKEGFEKINKARKKEKLPLFSSPRNTASGMLRQLDPQQIHGDHLHFFAYQLANFQQVSKESKSLLNTHTSHLDFLNKLHFDTNDHWKTLTNLAEVAEYFEALEKKRKQLPYESDGVVVKIDAVKDQNALGVVGRKPRYAIAWKFPPTMAQTKLLEVKYQVGRTGVVTPVGILAPVIINGVRVQRVSLHNQQEIERKDIRLGDTVEIVRSGDVIPKVLGVIKNKRLGNEVSPQYPRQCPQCHSALQQDASGQGIMIRCPNSQCPAQIHSSLKHFVSKEAMNIDGLGQEFIEEMLSKNIIRNAADLYRLKAEAFDKFERMGEKLKENLLAAIQKSKKTTLSRFIYALGIREIGEMTAKILAKTFKSIPNLYRATKDDFLEIEGIGEMGADHLHLFFQNKLNRMLIDDMLKLGVVPLYQETNTLGKLSGKKLLFSGTMKLPRRLAKERAEKAGAQLVSSLSQSTDYLVIGEKPGSKLKKAQTLGIEVINEERFVELCR